MLSYRHIFHAGNFADVFKHVLLSRLLASLSAKTSPYFYLDTHAGIGRYDLKHPWAQKAREYENGIARVWKAAGAPRELDPYLEVVRGINPDGKLRFYPGSPLIAKRFMRETDRTVLVELNPVDHEELNRVFHRQRRIATPLMDAYQALKAYVPPPERRGLVLIDSSFDRSRELSRILKALKEARVRWPTGIYAVWYPIMESAAMLDFERDVERSGIRKVLQLEIVARERDDSRVIPGCGMLVINPPWKFDEEAKPLLQWLANVLVVNGAPRSRVEWLASE